MLAYVLAWVVGLGSLSIYLAAFFFPEVHRKNDFIWSGIGFFYALVLWVYAERFRGGILLGQMASVALLVGFGWQMLKLRRQLTPSQQQTAFPDTRAVPTKVGGIKSNLQNRLANLPIRRRPSKQPQQVSQPQPLNAVEPRQTPPSQSPAIEQPSPTLDDTSISAGSSDGTVIRPQRVSPAGKTSEVSSVQSTPATKATAPEAAEVKLAPLQAVTSILTSAKDWVQTTFRKKQSTNVTIQPKAQSSHKILEPGQVSAPDARAAKEVMTSGLPPAIAEPTAVPEVVSEDPIPPASGAAPEDINVEQEVIEPDPSEAVTNIGTVGELENTAPAVEELTIAELASEVELTPSEPTPSDEPQSALEATLGEATATTSPDSETTYKEPKLVRPNAPDPELIDAARQNAGSSSDSLADGLQSPEITFDQQTPLAQLEPEGTSS